MAAGESGEWGVGGHRIDWSRFFMHSHFHAESKVICKLQMEQRDVVNPLPCSGNEPTYCARVVAAVSLAERKAPM